MAINIFASRERSPSMNALRVFWAATLCFLFLGGCRKADSTSGNADIHTMRFFQEVPAIQENWIGLEARVFGIKSAEEKVDWDALNGEARKLVEEMNALTQHYTEDAKQLGKRDDAAIKQMFIYIDSLRRSINKLVSIVGRLNKMTGDPNSWTSREYLAELDEYDKLKEEYKREGKQLNALFSGGK